MESVLIVASTVKGKELIADLLAPASYSNTAAASSGSEARRLIGSNEYDIIIINTPLSDEFGHSLAAFATQSSLAGVLLIAPREIADDVAEKVENYGVLVVEKPIVRQLFYQALKLVAISGQRIRNLRDENTRLQTKIDEIRIIDRAKCTLIQYLNMTEEQAHRYLERQAMDMRISKKKVAQRILNAYES